MYLKVDYNMLLSYLHESTCMHSVARDASALRRTIKTDKALTILKMSLSNLRYQCILMFPFIYVA